MASAVPVLVSARASLPEVVGDAGILLDPQDADATARALQALLDDAPQRDALAQRGRERAQRFTWEACAERTLHAYAAATAGDVANAG
jgi:glycosyltransferase involved in cell wall biosynthesis